MSQSPFLYPNVTSVPGTQTGGAVEKRQPAKQGPGEFDAALDRAYDETANSQKSPKPGTAASPVAPNSLGAGLSVGNFADASPLRELGSVREPLKFSVHANQRMMERKIKLDDATLQKVNDAVSKAAAKGVEDTLILTNDAALIVSVKNRTVVTAMDKAQLNGNVFTNIDGAIIV